MFESYSIQFYKAIQPDIIIFNLFRYIYSVNISNHIQSRRFRATQAWYFYSL